MKNPLTPAGIEPATFRIVAQHLNRHATAVPPISSFSSLNVYQMSLAHAVLAPSCGEFKR